jgi:hypothetical protein
MLLRLLPCEVPMAERVYFARVDDLGDWPEEIDVRARYFTLLLAIDAREIEDGAVTSFADRLLDQGLCGVHVFGPDCDRVDYLIDMAIVARELREGVDHPVDTTATWDGDIDDALWYVTFVLWPDDVYTDEQARPMLVLAVVGHPEWADHLEARLADFEGFSREMDERD